MVEKLRAVGAIILEKENKFFTLDQVVEVAGFDRVEVRRILEKLRREKLIITIADKATYQLRSNAEVELGKGRPPLSITYHIGNKEKLVKRVAPKLKENTALDRMWSIIWNKSEMDGHFTTHDVVILAGVGRENARWFLKMLRRAGFIRPSKARGQGTYWTLIKDPGPRRPYVGDQIKKR